MRQRTIQWLLPLLLLAVAPPAFARDAGDTPPTRRMRFTDARSQTREFMGYERTITLTPQQEAIKREALTGLAAPCCDDETAYTCCCSCNAARTWWGLANYVIAERGFGVQDTRTAVADWFAFINPTGFTGDACYTRGGCTRPFDRNGCGGMRPGHVSWD